MVPGQAAYKGVPVYCVPFSYYTHLTVVCYVRQGLVVVGGTPYNSQNGEAPPKGGTFFNLQVCEREGVSVVEVYERIVKSVIAVCTRT